jgi:hypothetical protein
MGQPVIMATLAGNSIIEINKRYAGIYYGLVIPAAAWPVEDWELSVNNYVYYTLIGILAAIATISAIGMQYFFGQLNDGMMKGVFYGTLVCTDENDLFCKGLSLGLCTMVSFHTLYTALQKHVYALAFERKTRE